MPTVDTTKVWTYEDYLALPDDGIRYEIVHGELWMTPAPSSYHQTLSKRLQYLLYRLELEGQGAVYDAPIDLFLPGATPVEPDLLFLGPDQLHLCVKRGIEGVPLLVVEILSPSTAGRDRGPKRALYAAAGVPHYWLGDLYARVVELFEFRDGSYRLAATVAAGDIHPVPWLPDLELDGNFLFEGIPEVED
jgi:Uma2 family endonuclease